MMDHAIDALRQHLETALELYQPGDSDDDIVALVEAMQVLELYYYGEERTFLDAVLPEVGDDGV